MGVADRDYTRARNRPGDRGRPYSAGLSATWALIIANTAVHLVRQVFGPQMQVVDQFTGIQQDWLMQAGHFSTGRAMFFYHSLGPGQPLGTAIPMQVWRFVTYQFLHADWFHLAFNMFGLFVFGPIVEEAFGKRKFLAFVMVCGIFGALTYVVLNLIGQALVLANMPLQIPGVLFYNPLLPLVGASAGVFGVIMACAYLAPNDLIDVPVRPLTIRMKPLAYIYLGIAIVQLLIGSKNAGGEAAHVGGAIAGFFFVRRAHLLSDFFSVVGGPKDEQPGKRRQGARPARQSRDGRTPPTTPVAGPAAPPRELMRPATPAEAEVDRILQKVSETGMDSLTDGERRTLETESARRRADGP